MVRRQIWEKIVTPKQELFCLEYLKDKNATQAYIRAGYKASTTRIAEVEGHKLLRKPEIQAKINESLTEVKEDIKVEIREVLLEMIRVAKSDVRSLYREDGSMKLPHEWDDATAAAVAGVEVVESYVGDKDNQMLQTTKKVKMWDKNRSLEMLGRHLKLFTDVLEVKDVTPMADRMKQARERAKGK